MSTGELGAVGVDIEGLAVPGLDSLPRNDDESVAGEIVAGFVASLDPGDIVDEVAALDIVVLTDRLVGWAQAVHLRAVADFVRHPEAGPLDDTPFELAKLGEQPRDLRTARSLRPWA